MTTAYRGVSRALVRQKEKAQLLFKTSLHSRCFDQCVNSNDSLNSLAVCRILQEQHILNMYIVF